jgi:hypothetical protein
MKKSPVHISLVLLITATALQSVCTSAASFNAFTYQGRIYDNGAPATGLYDIQFKLYSAGAGGFLYDTLTKTAVPVTNGLFSVVLDYGAGRFDGAERWLELAVQSNSVPPYQTLSPRQQLTSAPYAIYTDRAGLADVATTALNVGINGVATSALQSNAVTGAKIADGQVVRSVNGLTDHLTLAAGPNITLSTVGSTMTISGAAGAGSAWLLGGNGGTTPGVNFLGTTDSRALDLRVNNTRALSLSPRDTTANLIGGHAANGTSPNTDGSVIGGGGTLTAPNYIGGVSSNGYAGIFSGLGNTNAASASVIAGGETNLIDGQSVKAVIGGGDHNRVRDGRNSSVLGGEANVVTNGYYAAILSGRSNFLASLGGQGTYPDYATILGGEANTNKAEYATILGGKGVLADKYGQIAFGSKFATNGDAQASFYHLHGTSTANGTSEVYLDGTSMPLVLATNAAWSFHALIVGKTVGGTFEFAGIEVKGIVVNDVGTLYVYPTSSPLGGGVGTFTVTTDVDQIRQALIFKVSCSNSGTTRWSVHLRTSEIIVPGSSPI